MQKVLKDYKIMKQGGYIQINTHIKLNLHK